MYLRQVAEHALRYLSSPLLHKPDCAGEPDERSSIT